MEKEDIEVEIKVMVKDLAALEDFLESYGKLTVILQQSDEFYNHPARDFGQTDEALRIREETIIFSESKQPAPPLEFTYKGPKFDRQTKTRIEKTVSFLASSHQDMREILKHLEFNLVIRVDKERRQYTVVFAETEITLVIDEIDGLDEIFMELEILVKGKESYPKAKEKLVRLLETLGYSLENSIPTSYMELLLEKKTA